MLVGQYKSKLTDKDRVSVPVKIRQEIGSELIIARWYEQCLVLVSSENWQRLTTRLVGQSYLVTSPVRDIDRFIYSSAFEIKLDRQGRFVIPERLKTYSDIKSEVVFVGLGDRVEVWPSKKWEEQEKDVEKRASLALEKIARNERKATKKNT